ncbi:sigma-54-dependent Fis family transcriptional regulator [Deferribacter autotrophicus]|uniref:Sigma-54-dependent Fis family transcriptional regulator n=1 Tax=Deferribacter autotrophicus TaxID=500465 RepID=A0A5A8F5Y4_9BACT|nr:sigma-54 dependent transcriptional regulator [Deferribacter autotrophicus]KAA0258124.1 sigma-54-dependent Fis family transcriptional regulator [Deferribacter autotrophicus]
MSKIGNVLIIDDEEHILWLLNESLQDEFNVFCAKNSAKAEHFMNDYNIDVCLIDLFLENEHGLNLIEKWKDKYDTKFIVITAQDSSTSVIESMKAGAVDFISKPFELDELKEKIVDALNFQKSDIELPSVEYDFQSKSKRMLEIYKLIGKVSTSNINILITGETGTGKEVIARLIHKKSIRANKPFVAINMAAIPQELIESELFGHVRGAFTGANSDKAGKFEEANYGTIFLDEISEMDLNLQVKLLRVLQEREITRLGSNKPIKLDVRVIAATNKNLEELIEKGKFREDLYYRLNVINIELPPLRERKEDIPILVSYFLQKYRYIKNRQLSISNRALEKLISYHWPGNIRELENVIQHMIVQAGGDVIDISDMPEKILKSSFSGNSIKKELYELAMKLISGEDKINGHTVYEEYVKIVERPLIEAALEKTGNNKSAAAQLLGINRNTLRKKIKDYEIG